jgi:uncharacterized membrane protein YozB (DUF420 family)
MESGEFIGSIFAMLCGGTFFILYIISLVWAYNDANNRGKSGCIWALIIWFTWPLGLLAYLFLRDQEVRL